MNPTCASIFFFLMQIPKQVAKATERKEAQFVTLDAKNV